MAINPENVGHLSLENLGPRWRAAMESVARQFAREAIETYLPKIEEEIKQKMNDCAMQVICELVVTGDRANPLIGTKVEVRLNS